MKKIPRGWQDYTPFGEKVEGTMLFPFKTPLKQELVQKRLPQVDWFTPALLMVKFPKLRAIIDLTDTDKNTDRYYRPKDFIDSKVEHLKMRIPGGGLIPAPEIIKRFSDAVDGFVKKFSDDPDALIGVHCTHGLNRTGYFICKYLVTRLGWEPRDAIAKFQKARGHEIYRQNFIEDILTPRKHAGKRLVPDYRRQDGLENNVVNKIPKYWRVGDQEQPGPSYEPLPNVRNICQWRLLNSDGDQNSQEPSQSRFEWKTVHHRKPSLKNYAAVSYRTNEGDPRSRMFEPTPPNISRISVIPERLSVHGAQNRFHNYSISNVASARAPVSFEYNAIKTSNYRMAMDNMSHGKNIWPQPQESHQLIHAEGVSFVPSNTLKHYTSPQHSKFKKSRKFRKRAPRGASSSGKAP